MPDIMYRLSVLYFGQLLESFHSRFIIYREKFRFSLSDGTYGVDCLQLSLFRIDLIVDGTFLYATMAQIVHGQ